MTVSRVNKSRSTALSPRDTEANQAKGRQVKSAALASPFLWAFLFLICFCLDLLGESNIFLVYGDMGLEGDRADPVLHQISWQQWQLLSDKGYATYRIRSVTPETILRILADPQTLGFLYVGHALATEEQFAKGLAFPSVSRGTGFAQLDLPTILAAKEKLLLEGSPYRGAPSVKFVSWDTCHSQSCRNDLIKELGLRAESVWTWPGNAGQHSVILEYRNGHIGQWIDKLPQLKAKAASDHQKWNNLNNHYRLQHLISETTGNSSKYEMQDLITLAQKKVSRSNLGLWRELLELARNKEKTPKQIQDLLMSNDIWAIPELNLWHRDIQEARAEFLLELYQSNKIPKDFDANWLRATLATSGLDDDLRLWLLEEVGFKRATSPDAFIALSSVLPHAHESRFYRTRLEQLVKQYMPHFQEKLKASPKDRKRLHNAVTSGCHGLFRRLFIDPFGPKTF